MGIAINGADWRRDAELVQVINPTKRASALRRAAEFAVRGLGLRTRLPAAYGRTPIYISPANALRFLMPGQAKFDPFLFWMVDRFVKPGSVVWDIGANGGVFSTAAATIAGTVVAFEPDPFNIGLIARTMRESPHLDIRVAPIALSDRPGTTRLNIPRRGRSVASISGIPMGSQSGGLRESVDVEMTTADACLASYPAPAFVKCDIEGAEALMLRGAQHLLSDVRPVICIEVRDHTRDRVASEFARHGYRMHTADDAMTPLSDLADVCDTLAFPI